MKIFGLEIRRNKPTDGQESVVAPPRDDGSTMLSSATAGGYYSQVVDLETSLKSENELIRRYREISMYSDCDSAIDDIVNEAIVFQDDDKVMKLQLDDLKLSSSIKKKISEEFDNVLKLLKFNEKGHDIFRMWYIDGRMYYHVIVDEKNIKNGIAELRYIDPRKIRKIKDVKRVRNEKGVEVVTASEEYYLYNDKGVAESGMNGVKLPLDSVVYSNSGLIDQNSGLALSYLHKAIKPVNQLKMMEDALVIYRIARAPERRIFYVDVGNLPKMKAEQYVNDLMNRFRNKIVYDATTGEVRDDRKHLSMLEDFWMPRREGGRGTEITTLQGGQNLGQIEDIQFFQNKLYQSLNVPISRLKGETGFSLGRSTEITRDEIKFNKFVTRIRNKFSKLLLDALRIQLILKGIISPDDWDLMRDDIRIDYLRDNYFSELKENELMTGRLNILQSVDAYNGKYFSKKWIQKNVLKMSDDDIEEIDGEIKDEAPEEPPATPPGDTQDNPQDAQASPVSNGVI